MVDEKTISLSNMMLGVAFIRSSFANEGKAYVFEDFVCTDRCESYIGMVFQVLSILSVCAFQRDAASKSKRARSIVSYSFFSVFHPHRSWSTLVNQSASSFSVKGIH